MTVTYLYKDRFIEVTPTELTIKNYSTFFQKKRVQLKEIRAVFYKKQKWLSNTFVVSRHGWARVDTWWAHDMERNTPSSSHYNVVIRTNSSIKKGFTVTDIERFLAAMKEVLEVNVPIKNSLNY
uniref:Uncharacterized protein n=1 Tax=Acrobeloides nanus TaxID=290746 RepID=A0A914EGB1_9BILA